MILYAYWRSRHTILPDNNSKFSETMICCTLAFCSNHLRPKNGQTAICEPGLLGMWSFCSIELCSRYLRLQEIYIFLVGRGKKCKDGPVQLFTRGQILFYIIDIVSGKVHSVAHNEELDKKGLNRGNLLY